MRWRQDEKENNEPEPQKLTGDELKSSGINSKATFTKASDWITINISIIRTNYN
jgi:hypothetical protein